MTGFDEDKQLLKSDVPQPNPYDQSALFKIIILISISMISFGSYFSYDSVSATEADITKDLGLSAAEFGLLFSVYSFPNIGLVLVGGWLTDRIGNRLAALVFCLLIAVGTGIVAVAASVRSFALMLFGRFVFGMGSESSYVVQNSMCVEWFRAKYLAVAMAATISVSRMGSVGAFNLEPRVATMTGEYKLALWVAFLFCVLSVVFCVVFFIMDKWAKRDYTGEPDQAKWSFTSLTVIRKAFNLQYWLWVAIAVTIYSTIFPFRALASAQIIAKWGLDEDVVGSMMSTIDLTSLFISPVCGLLVDYTGKRGYLVIVGNAMGMAAYLILGLTSIHPMVGLVILGLHFSLMPAALWPCVPLLTQPQYEAFAFAVVSALINASLTGVIPLGGLLLDQYNFTAFCLFFAAISGLSVVLAVLWNYLDSRLMRPLLNAKGDAKADSEADTEPMLAAAAVAASDSK